MMPLKITSFQQIGSVSAAIEAINLRIDDGRVGPEQQLGREHGVGRRGVRRARFLAGPAAGDPRRGRSGGSLRCGRGQLVDGPRSAGALSGLVQFRQHDHRRGDRSGRRDCGVLEFRCVDRRTRRAGMGDHFDRPRGLSDSRSAAHHLDVRWVGLSIGERHVDGCAPRGGGPGSDAWPTTRTSPT